MEVGVSDQRGFVVDITLTTIFHNVFIDKTNINSRMIGTSSSSNIKEYKDMVKIYMNRRKILKK